MGLAQLCERAPDLATPAPDTSNLDNPALPRYILLKSVLQQCTHAAYEVSEAVSTTYFTHSGQINRSVGAA